MKTDITAPPSDIWSDWLLHHRHGGDPNTENFVRTETEGFADHVLNAVPIDAGMTLADIGTGDGLVAFRAISKLGPSLKVVLTDISAALLAHAEKLAMQSGVQHQCTFLECPADNLKDIADGSVDIVVTRAVLAYVADKPAAFSEFFRVLKPGGYISICEPIMRDDALGVYMLKKLVDAQSQSGGDRLLDLQYRIMAVQFPHTSEAIAQNPTTNFTERDLIHLARGAGFMEIHMELHIDSHPANQTDWGTFLESSPHPLAPPVKQIIAEHFTENDRNYFQEKFRPIVEAGSAIATSRNAYLTARKPVI